MLSRLLCLCYVIKTIMFMLCYQDYYVYVMLSRLLCLCYVIKTIMFMLCYQDYYVMLSRLLCLLLVYVIILPSSIIDLYVFIMNITKISLKIGN